MSVVTEPRTGSFEVEEVVAQEVEQSASFSVRDHITKGLHSVWRKS